VCGRFAFYSPAEATAALFGASTSADVKPRYNIAPTQDIAAVRDDDRGGRELVMLRWGLVPFWAKDASIGNRMINARAETVAEKPAYRAAFRHRRCVVLADGFYEWQKQGAGKTPYFISLASGGPFALAGLWEEWKDRQSDTVLQTATLITTLANEFMAPLHQRMPLVLEAKGTDAWLSGDADLLDDLALNMPALQAWPVDKRVNNARNEGPDLIAVAGDVIR
jgi:putative SOS response-associated peptidase YedK